MEELIPVNFHCHTMYSDGNLTPEVLAGNLDSAGVRYASLTDHDTLEGLPRFQEALEPFGIAFIPGVEITTFHQGREIHLLAYGFDTGFAELNATLFSIRQSRSLDVHSITNTIRSANSAQALGNGVDQSSSAAIEGRLDMSVAIALIHRARGLTFLAHPLFYGSDTQTLESLLVELIELGLDGIEAIYAPFSVEQQEDLRQIAEKHSLLISAGTDFHGTSGLGSNDLAVRMPAEDWNKFRQKIFRSASFSNETHTDNSSFLDGDTLSTKLTKKINFERKRSYVLRILLPTIAVLLLFLVVIWGYLLPFFEETLLDRKREMIKELTNSAWSILSSNFQDQQAGLFTEKQAQSLAISQVKSLRYGSDLKDYFWIQDYQPKMIMHPYRQDLNGQDLSGFADPRGVLIFVKFSEVVQVTGEGYVDYVWQWNDDPERLEPKESFVKGFDPWQWIIGTGIYMDDVEEEIAHLERNMVLTTLVISGIITLLLGFVLQQSFGIEKERRRIFDNLKESTDKYHALAEATTEGTLLILDLRCRYANPTMLSLLGYNLRQLEFLVLKDVLPDIERNEHILQKINQVSTDSAGAEAAFEGWLMNHQGDLKECLFTVNPIQVASQNGIILLCKEIDRKSQHFQRAGLVQLALNAPVGLIRASVQQSAPILEINHAAQKLLRLTTHVGNEHAALADLFQDKGDFDQFFSLLLAKKESYTEILHVVGPDSRVRTLGMTARIEPTAGEQETFIIAVIEDITNNKKQEAERTAIVEKLQSSLLFLHEPVIKMSGNVVVCDLNTSIERLASIMTSHNVSAALVATENNEIIGIVTDRDLRERVLAGKISTDRPVVTIMSAPVTRIYENTLVYEALLLMEEKGLSHLAVEDELGKIVRVVESKSLIQFQSYGPIVLLREIKGANSVDELSEYTGHIPMMVKTLVENSARTRHVTNMLASVGDAAVERVVQLALQEYGSPPGEFTFMALGSQGRQEQTLLTDQDNAIVYLSGDDTDEGETSEYFLGLGRKICQGLTRAGYARCRGNVMAENPFWCRSLPNWFSGLEEWMKRSEPEEIMRLSIFFDARPIYGPDQLVNTLRTHVFDMLELDPGYYFHAAQAALGFKPPTRLVGNIYLGGGNVEHPGEINLKDAMMPIVSFARLYALKYRINETNTLARINALTDRNIISAVNAEEICSAYDFLMQLRLKKQLDNILDGKSPRNVLLPGELGHMQHELLKQTFAQISAIQKKISYEFLGGM